MKTFVFISNGLNHHQLPLALELRKTFEFYFVATEPMSAERLQLGYKNMNDEKDFVIKAYEKDCDQIKLEEIVLSADCVVYSHCRFSLIEERIKQNKLTFKYSERLFKNFELIRKLHPGYRHRIKSKNLVYADKRHYLLCAGSYVANDYAYFGLFINKAYKYGYFPQLIHYDIKKLIEQKRNGNKIKLLFCGRFIKTKRAELSIFAAKFLKQNNIDFELNIIGGGKEEQKIKDLIKKFDLNNYVKIFPSVSFEKVRKYMEEANIYLFTSTKWEGWGAVLNESMNSGCAVISANKIGSANYLIKEGTNGVLFKNKKELCQKILLLATNRELREQLGEGAYQTISTDWNAITVAERFTEIIESDGAISFEKGVFSKA